MENWSKLFKNRTWFCLAFEQRHNCERLAWLSCYKIQWERTLPFSFHESSQRRRMCMDQQKTHTGQLLHAVLGYAKKIWKARCKNLSSVKMLHLWTRKGVRVKVQWKQLKPAVRMLHGPATRRGLRSWELRRNHRQGQDRALPARAQYSCAQARRARDTQVPWPGSASILFSALWMIFIISWIEMGNIVF